MDGLTAPIISSVAASTGLQLGPRSVHDSFFAVAGAGGVQYVVAFRVPFVNSVFYVKGNQHAAEWSYGSKDFKLN